MEISIDTLKKVIEVLEDRSTYTYGTGDDWDEDNDYDVIRVMELLKKEMEDAS